MKIRRPSQHVKRPRSYDGAGRRDKALQLHEKTCEVAREKFLAHGYAGTTIESIAATAGVSQATIYKSYGGKAGLVRSLCERALAGEGRIPAEQRSEALRSSSDAGAVIDGWGRLVAEVAPRIAPLLLLLRDAAEGDLEAKALLDGLERARIRRMADNSRYLAVAKHLRNGVTEKAARDVLWLCSSPELYDLLVNRRGWSISDFSSFVTATMKAALLPHRKPT